MVFHRGGKRYFKKYGKKFVSRSVKAYVNKAIRRNVEDKIFGSSPAITSNTISNAWQEYSLTTIPQSVGKVGRVGNQIRIKSFYLTGVMVGGQSNNALDDNRDTLRLIVGLYEGKGGVTPLATAGNLINDIIRTDFNSAQGSLIKKYYDRFIILPSMGKDSTGYMPSVRKIKIYKKFKKPLLIQWSSDATIYPNKNLILSIISDSVAAPSPGFTQGFCYITYEDA